jgi:hypothetical protein
MLAPVVLQSCEAKVAKAIALAASPPSVRKGYAFPTSA